VTDMSRRVPTFLLHALIDDFSSVPPSSAEGSAKPAPRSDPAAWIGSPAVGRRVVGAEHCRPGADRFPAEGAKGPVLVHGPAAEALAGWRSASAQWPRIGVDVAQDRDRHCVESVHRSLALLSGLPRKVPVIIELAVEPGWRDALDLILARGRSVRFSVCGVDAPDSNAMIEPIRAAVSERCAFSWSTGPWQPVTDLSEGPLPGILNVLLATAAALRGAGADEIGAELARTDQVDVVDSVRALDPATAQRIRAVLDGFAVRRVGRVVDALCGLDLLPKAGQDRADTAA
jgi:hypothetical protein